MFNNLFLDNKLELKFKFLFFDFIVTLRDSKIIAFEYIKKL